MTKAVLRSLIVLTMLSAAAIAQSTDQLFPTPVRTSEIVSTIKARDIGDSRLTTYYYTFEGEQGDVFINVQSRSFTGDLDLFIVPSQVPLTKIVIYADQAETETGRVVYLRKPERLMLRVQGRPPGDEEATIRIKFAGSFAISKLDDSSTPEAPKVESSTDTNVRVNSVGTILEVIPKVKATPDTVAEREDKPVADPDVKVDPKATDNEENDSAVAEKKTEPVEPSESDRKKVGVVVTDPVVEEPKKPATTRRATANRRRSTARRPPAVEPETSGEEKDAASRPPVSSTRRNTANSRRSRTATPAKKEEPPKVDPMANIRLVIYFKDGSTIERPMPEVQRFSVERAVLTVIHKNGTIGRYNMIDVLRVSIE